MRKIKLFKNVAFAAATTISAATIFTVSACTFKGEDPDVPPEPEPEELRLDSIKIKLPLSDFYVEKGKSQKADKPVEVYCYDQNGNFFSAETDCIITTNEGNTAPSWITIDKENKIIINGSTNPGTYNFLLFAQDKDGKVKSESKSFCVQIYEPTIVAPDHLEIITQDTNPLAFVGVSNNYQLTVSATKEGYDPDYISRECKWEILEVKGEKTKDLFGSPIFSLKSSENDCILYVSKQLDVTYVGEYIVSIKATSVLDPNISNTLSLKISGVNGFCFEDKITKITYLRSSVNGPWKIYRADPSVHEITNVAHEIYGQRVNCVRSNFMTYSGGEISTVLLPDWIAIIEDDAFKDGKTLYSLAMPGVKKVGANAFAGCSNMALLLNFPQPQLEEVGQNAFLGCTNFTLESENNISIIGDNAFSASGLETINLGSNVTSIGVEAFSDCPNLETITLNTTIPPKLCGPLYSGSTHLKSIKVPLLELENYKNSQQWSIYSDILMGI